MSGCGDGFVRALPSVEFVRRLAGLSCRVDGSLGSDARGGKHCVGRYRVVFDWTDEVFAPLLDCVGVVSGFHVRLFTIDQ